jgi:hypothetical protein
MRTTVTLDPDVVAQIKALMKEKGISFKEAVNSSIRMGSTQRKKRTSQYHQKTFNMGLPAIPVRKALQLAAEMEDEEILRDLTIRK